MRVNSLDSWRFDIVLQLVWLVKGIKLSYWFVLLEFCDLWLRIKILMKASKFTENKVRGLFL
jgi:hypothetical protein